MEATTHEHITAFIKYLQFEKRYSALTVRWYKVDLLQFAGYLQTEFEMGTMEPATITPGLIRSWLASLKGAKRTARTINRKISTLKSFFKYHLRQGNLEKTPMTGIVGPKAAKPLPAYVEQKEVETLFSFVEFPDNWTGRTEQLILAILYNTGMRRAELLDLKEHQVNLAGGSLKVLGKGNKERIIPVSNALIGVIKQYMKDKRSSFEAFDAQYLLVGEKGKRLYPQYIYRVVKKYLAAVTTMEKKSPHVLRHTFATHLTNNGAELNAVKELLGHSSLAATQIYTHNSIEKLKDVYKKAHPKA